MNKVPVAILGGHSPWKNLLGMITFPDMLKNDQAFCRFFTYNDGAWGRGRKDFDFDVKSITYLMEPSGGYKAWWLLGKNGEAVEIKAGISTIEQIPCAGLGREGARGYVESIKVICGALYVCGQRRQVYKRSGDQWQSLSDDPDSGGRHRFLRHRRYCPGQHLWRRAAWPLQPVDHHPRQQQTQLVQHRGIRR